SSSTNPKHFVMEEKGGSYSCDLSSNTLSRHYWTLTRSAGEKVAMSMAITHGSLACIGHSTACNLSI
ncbi:hypothetical protein Bpfe_009708, partial [Biomphalaria pfeifferi]